MAVVLYRKGTKNTTKTGLGYDIVRVESQNFNGTLPNGLYWSPEAIQKEIDSIKFKEAEIKRIAAQQKEIEEIFKNIELAEEVETPIIAEQIEIPVPNYKRKSRSKKR